MRHFLLPIVLLLSIGTTCADDEILDVNFNDLSKSEQKQVSCLAQNVFFESGGESDKGKLAVALVTLNRTKSDIYPSSICGVVKQKVKGTCQFSWVCNKSKNIVYYKQTETYKKILDMSTYVFVNNEYINDVTKGATHFHTTAINPGWYDLKRTARIGNHIFYKPKESKT